MKIVIFVVAPKWNGTNPIEMLPSEFNAWEDPEIWAQGWADAFPTDIIMLVEEDECKSAGTS